MNNKRHLDGIKIMNWNCQSIGNKISEFKAYLLLNNPEIVALSETFLKPDKSFSVPNYIVYRNDRISRFGGGVAILIKKEIAHSPLLKSSINDPLEYIGIQITSKTGKIYNIYAAYLPPNSPLIDTHIIDLTNNRNTTLIIGDLNAKHKMWGCSSNNAKGNVLKSISEKYNIDIIAPSEHTHYDSLGKSDILDIIIAKKLTSQFYIRTETALSSDHLPVHIEICGSDWLTIAPPTNSKTCWNIFQSEIEKLTKFSKINNILELDNSIYNLESNIKIAAKKATIINRVVRNNANLPSHIKELIKNKNMARKKYQQTLSPIDKNILNNLNNKLKNALSTHINNQWDDKINNINNDDTPPWRFIKNLKNKKQQTAPLKNGNQIFITNKEKADAFAEMLEAQFTPNHTKNPIHTDTITFSNLSYLSQPLNLHSTIDETKLTNYSEIRSIIKTLKTKKAPGDDIITNTQIKNLPPIAVHQITEICNAILKLQHFPQRWKTAKIILFPKAGKPINDVNSYRPISLLSNISKIIERVIIDRLNQHIITEKVIPEEQFGFIKEHSTIHQISRITESILKYKNISTPTGGVFLDIAKAFDRVWHDGLIHKLIKFKFSPPFIQIIYSYLSNRKFYCINNTEKSDLRNIKAGVPQGSVLGPTLYNIFISDIPKNNNTMIAMYADDTALLTSSRRICTIISRLQMHLTELENWFDLWRIQVNPEKTQAIIFTNKFIKHSPSSLLKLNDTQINWTDSVKYLGVTLDQKLNFNKHTEIQLKKAKIIKSQLYPLLKSKKLESRIKINIYKSVLRPVLTYASETWIQTAESNLNKLQRFQNITVRQALNAQWYHPNVMLQREANLQPIVEFIKKITIATHKKMTTHANQSIKRSLDYEPNPKHKFKRAKTALDELIHSQTQI